ncbi:stage II sporulation protein R [Bacillus sp. 03113]|uniref:stage II sporulation protein R n=1 Tax=Bacillus sp. 03113 TaxID=2578211 RepID=UPI0011432692|nr:stage II sporulation protein R [Bacillus sp. 03113]
MRIKHMAIIYLLTLIIGTIFSLYIPKNEVTAKNEVVIPNEAIRLRILANSDKEEDQAVKRRIRDEVNKEITGWVKDLTSIKESRRVIKHKLPEINKIAERIMREEKLDQNVKVEYGKVNFPTKLYGQFLYPSGQYEAVLITLGNGKGANWWCVLYPPLCFLDFSNGVAVGEGFEEKGASESQKTNDGRKIETTENNDSIKHEDDVDEAVQNIKKVMDEKDNQSEVEKAAIKAINNNRTNSNTKESSANNHKQVEEEKLVNKSSDHSKEEQNQTKNSEKASSQKQLYVQDTEDKVEVRFFVKDIWDKIAN